jgi:hypothetical protein
MNGDPYKDRWGVRITALAPMFHPNSDRTPAVLGMDFNAATWKWDVATKTTLPALPGGARSFSESIFSLFRAVSHGADRSPYPGGFPRTRPCFPGLAKP